MKKIRIHDFQFLKWCMKLCFASVASRGLLAMSESIIFYPLLSYFSTSDKKPPLNHDRLYSVTRVPMNVITCGALLCLHVDWVSRDKRLVFGACLVLCLIGESVIVQVRRVLSYICTALWSSLRLDTKIGSLRQIWTQLQVVLTILVRWKN